MFAPMSRHFIIEASYFTKRRGMHQREKKHHLKKIKKFNYLIVKLNTKSIN